MIFKQGMELAVELRLTELMIVVREREGRLEGGLGFTLVERRILGFRVLDILAINMFKRVRCRSRLLRVLWSQDGWCQGEEGDRGGEGEIGGGSGPHVGGEKGIGVQSSGYPVHQHVLRG